MDLWLSASGTSVWPAEGVALDGTHRQQKRSTDLKPRDLIPGGPPPEERPLRRMRVIHSCLEAHLGVVRQRS